MIILTMIIALKIDVIATSIIFSNVIEIALGMTLSILRNIHNAHFDFVKGKENMV